MKVLIVDGYNVIRLTPPYRDLAEADLDSARTALISDIGAYAQDHMRATVVFDGAANRRSDGLPHSIAGVTVVFSPYGVEADTVIESLARSARERGDEVEVVTSDAQTQWAVMGGGVARRSSKEFSGELREGEREWREHNPRGRRSVRIEDVLDPETRERLARWARGEE